jgi:glc operon protein GlcG
MYNIVVRSISYYLDTMKIIAASISFLLPATNAFSPQLLAAAGRGTLHRPLSTTALSSSYLDNLSSLSSRSSFTATDEQATEILDSAFRRTVSSTSSTPTSPRMSKLSLADADTLANGVIDNVKRNDFPPIVVTVVDRQANILVQKRMDDVCHAAFPEFSYAKAYTCVTMGVSSREFRDKYTVTNDSAKIGQMNSMMAISGKMAAFPGGIILRNEGNEIIGAIGVSGASGDEDEYVALNAAWESGLPLHVSPKEHSCTTVKSPYFST